MDKMKMAKWKLIYEGENFNTFQCSNCDDLVYFHAANDIGEYKYCPHCGKRIEK